MKDNNEIQKMFFENTRLVYYLVNKLELQTSLEYDDIISEGMVGLLKAAQSFDSSKGYRFATYATRCIQNEIFMYLRKLKKHQRVVLASDFVAFENDEELNLYEQMEDSKANFIEDIENKESFDEIVNIILNCLSNGEKLTMLYQMSEITQTQISERLSLSQSYVSRLLKKAKRKIKKVLGGKIYCKEIFFMSTGKEYKISFSPRDIKKFNKAFSDFLKNVDPKALPDFQISCNQDRIVVQTDAHPMAFDFIARIIQEIDEFNMTYSSRSKSRIEKKKIDSAEEIVFMTSNSTERISECLKRGEKSKQIRDYILKCEHFSRKQIKKHFPLVSDATISNEIQKARKDGIINPTGRGVYDVKKT